MAVLGNGAIVSSMQLGHVVSQLRALGPLRLTALLGAALATLAALGAFAFRVTEPPMALLYGELDTRDAAGVVAALERARVPHRIGRSGSEIYAPEDQIPRLRLTLAREGLPTGGSIGYEVFDRQNGLTATPFQQDINRLRALEGEIARTLRGLAGVSSARVHLVLPRREAFSRERAEAQASVVLQMRGSQRLDRAGVQSVLHLVAAAVPGLRAQNIAVVDGRGELLARGGRPVAADAAGDGTGSGLPPHEEMRRTQETRMARGLEEMLERALGAGRVRVEATLDLDHARQQTTEERFDPDNQVPRSQQSVTENNRNGEQPSVSVANQLPGAPPAAAGNPGPQSQELRQEEMTNFEIGRTTRTTVREQPLVRRLSVAVLVDAVREPAATPGGAPAWRERTPEELARIGALVRGAIGFDEARGDRVEVVSFRFADSGAEVVADPAAAGGLAELLPPAMLARLVESGMFALLAVAAIFFVVRPMMKRVTAIPITVAPAIAQPGGAVAAALAGTAPDGAGLLADEKMVSIAMVEGQMRASSLTQVGELADRHPDETLAIVRRWLAPQEQRT